MKDIYYRTGSGSDRTQLAPHDGFVLFRWSVLAAVECVATAPGSVLGAVAQPKGSQINLYSLLTRALEDLPHIRSSALGN